ncbi:hypothetical protein F4678DRAFT_458493 [Xylaria arbuscula]|nr:hypothetical protein F4678DRAFT_458493 [Xylaria arbuscula]
MLYSSLLFLSAFELLAQATESYSPLSSSSPRRQLMTCDQTYGNGSIPCGEPQTAWCYNPDLGQTCCHLDGGFCTGGNYCAPVAGYCCLEGEDLATCATRAGFELPNSAVNDYIANPNSAVATPARASRTFTVTPFLTPAPGPTPIDTPGSAIESSEETTTKFLTEFTMRIATVCHETPSPSAVVVVQITNTSASSPNWASKSASPSVQASASTLPFVQVSMGARDVYGQINSIFMIVLTGVFVVVL